MSDDLVAWLRAQLDEDAMFAREAVDREWFSADNYVESRDGGEVARFEIKADARHASGWSPARVLAEVAAKRRIIDEHPNVNDGDCGTCVHGRWGYPTHGGSDPQLWPCDTLRLLASVYAGRPGWRSEWAPDEEENHA